MCDLHKPVAEGPVEHSVPSRRGLHSRSRRRASVEAPERSHVSPRGNAMTVDSVAQRSADMRWMALGPRPVCFPRAGFPEGPATEGTTRSPANKMLPSVAEVIRSAASGEGSALRSAVADGLFARKEAKDLPVMQLPSTTTPSACSLNSFGLNSAAFTTTQLQALVIAQLAAQVGTSEKQSAHRHGPSVSPISTVGSLDVQRLGTTSPQNILSVAPNDFLAAVGALAHGSADHAEDWACKGIATPPVAREPPSASRRPLQALAFEDFLHEQHRAGVVLLRTERSTELVPDDGGARPIGVSGWTVLDVQSWWEQVRRWTGEGAAFNERAFFMMLRRLGFKPKNRAPPPATSGLDYGLRREGVTHGYLFDVTLFMRYRKRARAARPVQ